MMGISGDKRIKKVEIQASDREALIDELMSLVDFGQVIGESYVRIAAERCLRIILMNGREGDGGE